MAEELAPERKDQPRALVVDEDNEATKSLIVVLRENGYEALWARDGERAHAILNTEAVDVMISEIRRPQIDGLDLLRAARLHNPEVCAVMISDGADVPLATECMRQGAYDFQVRPLNLDKLMAVLRRGIEHQRLVVRASELSRRLDRQFSFDRILGSSLAISQVCETLSHIAPTRATVLLTGETGTGKDLCAQAIHQHSPRRNEIFVKTNCAALSPTLIEPELFGHEAGAFTGATRARAGRFEIAHNGTLFLDEVGELPLETQVKMLRILDERVFERVGGTRSRKVDVRLIAATNRNLEEAVRQGRFRQDFYFRLNVVSVRLPPLRERREDIPILANNFLAQFNAEHHRQLTGFSREALALFNSYPWPGNVRELRHVIEQAVILSSEGEGPRELVPADFAPALQTNGDAAEEIRCPVTSNLPEIEKKLICRAYAYFNKDKRATAESLGIALRTLYRKLKEYGEE